MNIKLNIKCKAHNINATCYISEALNCLLDIPENQDFGYTDYNFDGFCSVTYFRGDKIYEFEFGFDSDMHVYYQRANSMLIWDGDPDCNGALLDVISEGIETKVSRTTKRQPTR